jgi:hypothetical protein
VFAQAPHPIPGGYSLPNGWRITPVGKAIPTEDLILNLTGSRDGKVVIAQHGGFNPHGQMVIDAKTEEAVQRIGLTSAWLGPAWSHDGSKLYVSGGSAGHPRHPTVAPIYVFDYADGRLSEKLTFRGQPQEAPLPIPWRLQQPRWQCVSLPSVECQMHCIRRPLHAEPPRSDQERKVNEIFHAAVGGIPRQCIRMEFLSELLRSRNRSYAGRGDPANLSQSRHSIISTGWITASPIPASK